MDNIFGSMLGGNKKHSNDHNNGHGGTQNYDSKPPSNIFIKILFYL